MSSPQCKFPNPALFIFFILIADYPKYGETFGEYPLGWSNILVGVEGELRDEREKRGGGFEVGPLKKGFQDFAIPTNYEYLNFKIPLPINKEIWIRIKPKKTCLSQKKSNIFTSYVSESGEGFISSTLLPQATIEIPKKIINKAANSKNLYDSTSQLETSHLNISKSDKTTKASKSSSSFLHKWKQETKLKNSDLTMQETPDIDHVLNMFLSTYLSNMESATWANTGPTFEDRAIKSSPPTPTFEEFDEKISNYNEEIPLDKFIYEELLRMTGGKNSNNSEDNHSNRSMVEMMEVSVDRETEGLAAIPPDSKERDRLEGRIEEEKDVKYENDNYWFTTSSAHFPTMPRSVKHMSWIIPEEWTTPSTLDTICAGRSLPWFTISKHASTKRRFHPFRIISGLVPCKPSNVSLYKPYASYSTFHKTVNRLPPFLKNNLSGPERTANSPRIIRNVGRE